MRSPSTKILALTVVLAIYEPALPSESPSNQLAACQKELKIWKDWAGTNVPKYNELVDDYDRLMATNKELRQKLEDNEHGHEWYWVVLASAIAFGFGSAIYCLRGLARFIKRSRPFSPARKQLCVLVSATSWTALMVLANWNPSHPINALAGVVVWSLPAMLLAAILFWWYRRSETQQP